MHEGLVNVTVISEFLLMGFPGDQVLQRFYASVFFLVYLAALMGNLLIVTLTSIDQQLQAPMYFFLKNLSLIDICYISTTVPKCIMNTLTNSHSISFVGCASQVFLVIFLAGTEYALLLVMSYDRYAAICHPLHYEAIMNRGACVQMVTVAWLSGCVYGSLHVAGTFSVRFCGPNTVNQFFCDVPSLLILSCAGDQILEYAIIIASCCFDFGCFIFMAVSYIHIFSTVLRIPSDKDRFKSFSTCLPHLIVVTIFLISRAVTYLGTKYKSIPSLNLFISVLYSLLPPSLNPLIYSLRNKNMKAALYKILPFKHMESMLSKSGICALYSQRILSTDSDECLELRILPNSIYCVFQPVPVYDEV
ncbi:olfactory receptor 14A16-like [Erinaceus europaeus]|uniref:Olfactory receptor n=1 Tax=Erinaceus europaeus TaxID=9365 RepID=A0A1S3AF70_ERIEU|nr:olfactory receptor 14A16-like [Erinaceus europaeus]